MGTSKPDWTDKYLSKLTLGNWVRVPGTEHRADDDAERDRPEKPLGHWARRHGLPIYAVLMFVLPGTLFVLARNAVPGVRLSIAFLPSLIIAFVLLKF